METSYEDNILLEYHEPDSREQQDHINSQDSLENRRQEAHKLHHWHSIQLPHIHKQGHGGHDDQQRLVELGQPLAHSGTGTPGPVGDRALETSFLLYYTEIIKIIRILLLSLAQAIRCQCILLN